MFCITDEFHVRTDDEWISHQNAHTGNVKFDQVVVVTAYVNVEKYVFILKDVVEIFPRKNSRGSVFISMLEFAHCQMVNI